LKKKIKKVYNVIVFAWMKDFFGKIKILKAIRDFRFRKVKCKMNNLFSLFASKGDLVFDVGANAGVYSEIYLNLGARVIAIEPQKNCVRYLENIFKNNKNLIVIGKALGEREGKGELMISPTNDGHSTMSKKWLTAAKQSGRFSDESYIIFNKPVEIQITTLDRLIEEYGTPQFIKIDVEGFEYNVLKGLAKPVKALSFEFHPEILEEMKKCILYLEELGDYHFNYSIGDSFKLELPSYITGEELIGNMLRLPDKSVCGDIYCKLNN
jgi:FkbM family methyltransferase